MPVAQSAITAADFCRRVVPAPNDIPRVVETCHGINIKLDKCGGVFEAQR